MDVQRRDAERRGRLRDTVRVTRDVTDLVLSFTDRWSGVGGTVKASNGASVLVFRRPTQWNDGGWNPRRLRTTQRERAVRPQLAAAGRLLRRRCRRNRRRLARSRLARGARRSGDPDHDSRRGVQDRRAARRGRALTFALALVIVLRRPDARARRASPGVRRDRHDRWHRGHDETPPRPLRRARVILDARRAGGGMDSDHCRPTDHRVRRV